MRQLKTILFTIICCAFAVPLFSQISAGGGISYGTEIEKVAINVRGLYEIDENWGAGLDFNFFLGVDNGSFVDLNPNANYIFAQPENAEIYALAGLNIAIISFDLGPFGNTSNTELGLNLGAGGRLQLADQLKGVVEVRYVIGDFDQLVANVGVIYEFVTGN